jgi:hypothetical protein
MAGDEGYGSPAVGPSAPFTANVPQATLPTTLNMFRRNQPTHLGGGSSSQPNPQTQAAASVSKPAGSSRAFTPGILPNTQLSSAPGSAARLAGLTQPVSGATTQDAPLPRLSASAPPFSSLSNIAEVSEPATSPAHRTRSQVIERERQASSPAPGAPSSSPGSGKDKHRSSKKKMTAASLKRMQTRSGSSSALDRPSPLAQATSRPEASSSTALPPKAAALSVAPPSIALPSKDILPATVRPALSSKNVNPSQLETTQTKDLRTNKRKAEISQAETSIKPKSLTRTVSAASSSETVTADGDESSRSGPSPNKRVRRSAAPRLTDSSSLLPPSSRATNPFAGEVTNAANFDDTIQPQANPLPTLTPGLGIRDSVPAASSDRHAVQKDIIQLQKQKAQALLARPAVGTPLSSVTQAGSLANAPSLVRPRSRAASPQRQTGPQQSAVMASQSAAPARDIDPSSALVSGLMTLVRLFLLR